MAWKPELREMSDLELLDLLDAVSEEVKRRNAGLGPDVDVRGQTVQQNVAMVLGALADLNISVKPVR